VGRDGYRVRYSETVCHITPATVVVIAIFFGFAAVSTAVDDQRLGVGDGHFEEVGCCWCLAEVL